MCAHRWTGPIRPESRRPGAARECCWARARDSERPRVCACLGPRPRSLESHQRRGSAPLSCTVSTFRTQPTGGSRSEHWAIRDGLATARRGQRVLCGDLNTPRRELPDGEVISFARDSRGRLRPERGSEWDEAELGVVPGLRELGYRDAFRELHGYAQREPSWTWRRIAGHDGGWRLDHVFASEELRAASAAYHHAWRDEGLSDHSALEVDLQSHRSKTCLARAGT